MFDITDSMCLEKIDRKLGTIIEREKQISKRLDSVNAHLVEIGGVLEKVADLLMERSEE